MRLSTNRIVILLAAVIAIALLARIGISQEQTAKSSTPPTGAPDAAKMAEWMKMNSPGEQHAALKKMAGKFTADCTMKMAADAPEMKSKGELTSTMILGDRYLRGEYTGDFMGQTFHGEGITGYDNIKKKHFTTWMDDMSTGIMVSEGDADSSNKVITYKGECPCPEEGGKMKTIKQVLTIRDDDHYSFEMFTTDKDGKELRSMKIDYTRVK